MKVCFVIWVIQHVGIQTLGQDAVRDGNPQPQRWLVCCEQVNRNIWFFFVNGRMSRPRFDKRKSIKMRKGLVCGWKILEEL
jgi:hypothetical protein